MTQLSPAGASVLLAGRTEAKLQAAADSLTGPARIVQLDVSDTDAGSRLVATAVEAFGRLDVMIANAGVYVPGNIWERPATEFERLISTNVSGTINIVQAAVIAMRAAGRGDVIVTSSVSGHQAIQWEPVHSASKYAVQALVHGVRRQLIGSGVRIGAVAPGVVLNDLWQVTDEDAIVRRLAAGRGVRSEDVADAIIFMLTRPRHVAIRDLVILPVNQDI